MNKDCFDDIELYCRRLGHYVTFKYCRTMDGGKPCRGIFDCAFEKLPVREYMAEHFTQEEIAAILSPPESKISSILDLIERAKKTKF